MWHAAHAPYFTHDAPYNSICQLYTHTATLQLEINSLLVKGACACIWTRLTSCCKITMRLVYHGMILVQKQQHDVIMNNDPLPTSKLRKKHAWINKESSYSLPRTVKELKWCGNWEKTKTDKLIKSLLESTTAGHWNTLNSQLSFYPLYQLGTGGRTHTGGHLPASVSSI